MATTISQRELRNDSGSIMRRVEQGESFVVTRNGAAVADLVPHQPDRVGKPSRFVPVGTVAAGTLGLPTWGAVEFAAELRASDLALDDDDRDPWTEQQ